MSRHNELFRLPNSIFNAGLTVTELTVLAAVYSLRSRSIYKGKKYIKINQKSIATICNFKSTVTVSRAIDKLVRIGFIERISRYYDDYKKLGAYVYTIPCVKGKKYFFVSRRIFKYKLSSAQLRMYLYFCKCAESHSKRFWNSFNDICQALKLKRSAVIKTIDELCTYRLIKKYHKKKKDGSYSDNHYRIINLKPPRRKIDKKGKHRLAHGASKMIGKSQKKPIYIIIIILTGKNVKYIYKISRHKCVFFSSRGSPFICSTLYSTHSYPTERKNNIKLYLKLRCNLNLYNYRIDFCFSTQIRIFSILHHI